jgi:peptidyl-prolyl cis-trans isomerase D
LPATTSRAVAKVAGQPSPRAEFDNAMRERVDRARRQMPNLDARMFETPEMRAMALDGVIRDRLTLVAADSCT